MYILSALSQFEMNFKSNSSVSIYGEQLRTCFFMDTEAGSFMLPRAEKIELPAKCYERGTSIHPDKELHGEEFKGHGKPKMIINIAR